MNTFKKTILLSFAMFPLNSLLAYSPRPAIRYVMSEYFATINHMAELMDAELESLDSFKTQLSVQPQEDSVLITANEIGTDNVDASINDTADNIIIKTDRGIIEINTTNGNLDVSFQHSQEQENEIEKNKNDKSQQISRSFSTQSYHLELGKVLDLSNETLKIDYDKKSKTLSIEIPFIKEAVQSRKSIAVNIKN